MRGTGFVVVGGGLFVAALATGAGLLATLSVALGATCGALAWRLGRHQVRVAGGRHLAR
jgi:hypothetical protein